MAQERNRSGRPNQDNDRGDWETRDQRREQEQQGSSAGWHGEGYGGGPHDEDRNEFGGQGRFREEGGHGSHFGGAPQPQEVHGWPHGAESPASHDDEDYHHWLQQQISRFYEDYAAWRQERRQKFADDFDRWRSERAKGSGEEAGKASGETGQPKSGRKTDK